MTKTDYLIQRCKACEKCGECAYAQRGMMCLKLDAARDGIEWAWEHTENLWVSVNDSLPDYEEDILVACEDTPSEMWFAHRTNREEVVTDSNGFTTWSDDIKITHWQRIEPIKKK